MKKLFIITLICGMSGSTSLKAQSTSLDVGVIAGYRTGQSLQLGYHFNEALHLDVVLPFQKAFLLGEQPSTFYSQLMIRKDFFIAENNFYYTPGIGAAIGSGSATRITAFPEYSALASIGLGVKLGKKMSLEISPFIGYYQLTPSVIDNHLNFDCQLTLRASL